MRDDIRIDFVHIFPGAVWDLIWHRGGFIGAFFKGSRNFLMGDRRSILKKMGGRGGWRINWGKEMRDQGLI